MTTTEHTYPVISVLWETGLYTWDDIAKRVSSHFGCEITSEACRKRYKRYKAKQDKTHRERTQKHYCNRLTLTDTGNVLVIGDPHIPMDLEGYLGFCYTQKLKYDCQTVICIGDLVDHHALSQWDHDPDGYSSGHEASATERKLMDWIDIFPEMYILKGNHDQRHMRLGFKAGIPIRYFKTEQEIWHAPPGWKWALQIVADDVLYEHGITRGIHAAYNRALKLARSVVMGHVHKGTVVWLSNDERSWFGMSVGCGVDIEAYGMTYAKSWNSSVVLGCSVVCDMGTLPIFLPFQPRRIK